MSKNKFKENKKASSEDDNFGPEDDAQIMDNFDDVEAEDVPAEETDTPSEVEELRKELENQKKEYMFLMADFDNFKKRTYKEKSELIKNGGEAALRGLLPIIDDFERGIKASESAPDSSDVVEGMKLIYNKFIKYLAANGVKEFDPEDKEFNPDRHEAISVVPVADDSLKGKILDTVEKGYMLNDKVLRHAKVVVGQ